MLVRITVLILVAVGGSPFYSGHANAQTIIYENITSQTGGFRFVSSTTWEAQRFNSDSVNVTPQKATLELFSNNGGTGTFFLDLYPDDSGQPGAEPIETLFTGPNPFSGPFPSPNSIFQFDDLNLSLDPNTNYWLVLGLNAGATFDLRWGVLTSPANPPGMGSGYQDLNAVTNNQGTNWSLTTANPRKLRLIGIPIIGDVNNDGGVNLLDVAPFVAAITSGTFIPEADINDDGFVNLLDVAPFVDLLTGG